MNRSLCLLRFRRGWGEKHADGVGAGGLANRNFAPFLLHTLVHVLHHGSDEAAERDVVFVVGKHLSEECSLPVEKRHLVAAALTRLRAVHDIMRHAQVIECLRRDAEADKRLGHQVF